MSAFPDTPADVIVIGAGLAGSTAAAVLGRQGVRVVLVDPRADYPPCFKAEKIEPDQAALLRKFGLLDSVVSRAGQIREVLSASNGLVFRARALEQYGIHYHDLVNAIRRQIPSGVQVRTVRVGDVASGAELQRVTLASGETITARLVVLACGTGGQLHGHLGIRKQMIRRGHSLAFGFNIAPVNDRSFEFDAVTYHPAGCATRAAYLTLFLIESTMRANLFVYHAANEAWVRQFIGHPEQELARAFPKLARLIGDFRVVSQVQAVRIDLYTTNGHRRPGLVLAGDAFQSVCPTTGGGVSRVLTDVDVLCCECLPEWLSTPGMGVEKIDRFYEHPRKRATDEASLHGAEYWRRLAIDSSLGWRMRRARGAIEKRLLGYGTYFRFTRKLTACGPSRQYSASSR